MDRVRRTALVLHSLSPSDRTWLLERLPLSARAKLVPLLDELRELGFPTQADLVKSAMTSSVHTTGTVEKTHIEAGEPAQLLAELAQSTPQAVHAAIADERDDLIAEMLCLTAWPWEAPLLGQLPTQRQLRIGRLKTDLQQRSTPVSTPMRREALLRHLARATKRSHPVPLVDPGHSPPASGWSRLTAWMGIPARMPSHG